MVRVAILAGICLAGCLISSGCRFSRSIQTYNLGDRVQAGPLVYTAYDTHWDLTLGSADNPRVPANRFLLVRMNITNGGAVDCRVPTLILLDDLGHAFNEVSDGTGITDWLGIARNLAPLGAQTGLIAFDVPPRHYKMRVADEAEQIVSYIDLPLNFVTLQKDH